MIARDAAQWDGSKPPGAHIILSPGGSSVSRIVLEDHGLRAGDPVPRSPVRVKHYIVEAGSPAVQALVARAETVAVCRIAWAEACAALARRAGEVPADEGAIIAARQALEHDWPHFFIFEVTQSMVERAGEFAETFSLRGYDSEQLAAVYEILAVMSDPVFSKGAPPLPRVQRVVEDFVGISYSLMSKKFYFL